MAIHPAQRRLIDFQLSEINRLSSPLIQYSIRESKDPVPHQPTYMVYVHRDGLTLGQPMIFDLSTIEVWLMDMVGELNGEIKR